MCLDPNPQFKTKNYYAIGYLFNGSNYPIRYYVDQNSVDFDWVLDYTYPGVKIFENIECAVNYVNAHTFLRMMYSADVLRFCVIPRTIVAVDSL